MKLIIDIDEDVRIAITRVGLLRIPDEMQEKVDKAIQSGKPLEKNIKSGIALPEGITNGEVVTALFPDAKKTECTEYHYLAFAPSCNLECCNEDWWSAPFDYTTLDKEDGERECE